MIERHITFNVHPESTSAFERFFAETYRPAMSRSPGFLSAGLLREMDQANRYQMVLRFEDLESAAGWRTSDVHQALQPGWSALFSDSEVNAYEVVV
jgi:heme-degrading monooxygenase HmoA